MHHAHRKLSSKHNDAFSLFCKIDCDEITEKSIDLASELEFIMEDFLHLMIYGFIQTWCLKTSERKWEDELNKKSLKVRNEKSKLRNGHFSTIGFLLSNDGLTNYMWLQHVYDAM